MNDSEIRAFVEDRDKTFTNAVLNDDWVGVREYCKSEEIGRVGVFQPCFFVILGT